MCRDNCCSEPSPAPVQCWDLPFAALGAPRVGHLPGPESKHLNPRTAVSCNSGLNRGANSKWILSPLGACSHAPQSEFGGSTHLVASTCWDQMLWPLVPPSAPLSDPCRPRHGRPAPCPGPLDPDHEGGGDRSQQVPATSSQAVPRECPRGPAGQAGLKGLPWNARLAWQLLQTWEMQ